MEGEEVAVSLRQQATSVEAAPLVWVALREEEVLPYEAPYNRFGEWVAP